MRNLLTKTANTVKPSAIILLVVSSCSTFAIARQTPPEILFADTHFQQGFLLSYPHSSRGRAVEAVLNLDNMNNVPVWRLCQWGTKHTLGKARCVHGSAGDASYENKAKKIVVGGPASENRDLILEVRGRAEYGANARKRGESWPHLLVEQDALQLHRLDELNEVQFQISLRLLHCTSHSAADVYDPGLHAAQFQMFLIVKNIEQESDDHGNYYWFGVPFFDSRHDIPPAYMAKDAGKDDATGKFIYTIDGRAIEDTPLKDGQWVTIRNNLLPHIRGGLREAVNRGYVKDDDSHHYAIANMNLGWEIPGTFDAAVQIRDFRLSAVSRARAGSAFQQEDRVSEPES